MRARAGHPRREFPSIIASIPRAHVTYRSQSWAVPMLRFRFCEETFFPAVHAKKHSQGDAIQIPRRQKVQDNTLSMTTGYDAQLALCHINNSSDKKKKTKQSLDKDGYTQIVY